MSYLATLTPMGVPVLWQDYVVVVDTLSGESGNFCHARPDKVQGVTKCLLNIYQIYCTNLMAVLRS